VLRNDQIEETTEMALLMMSMSGSVDSSLDVPLAKEIDCRFSFGILQQLDG